MADGAHQNEGLANGRPGEGYDGGQALDFRGRHDGASSTMQMMEMFKIRGGQLHAEEAIDFAPPYGAKSGWEQYRQ